MATGWIKTHRNLLEWEWYKTPNMVHFFTHCLLRANHEPKKWQGQTIEIGQFISGRKALSQETGLSEKVIRTCIERLKSTSELATKTSNQFTVFTIISWEKYQSKEDEGQQTGQPRASEGPAKGHKQELKELKKNIRSLDFCSAVEFPYLKNENFKKLFEEHLEIKKIVKTERAILGRLKDLHEFPIEWCLKRIEDAIQKEWRGFVFEGDKEKYQASLPKKETPVQYVFETHRWVRQEKGHQGYLEWCKSVQNDPEPDFDKVQMYYEVENV
jgi:hypothetical protein